MSGVFSLDNIECASQDCPLYVSIYVIGPLFIAADYFPLIITVAMFAIALYHYDIYFFLISLILTFDWGLNVALQYIIRQPPRYHDCGSKYEMPSCSTQHGLLFMTIVLTFFVFWRERISISKLFLANFLVTFVITARVYLGVNTVLELVIGAIVGVVEGLFFQLIIYFFIYPNFDNIVSWKAAIFIGLKNNVCRKKMVDQDMVNKWYIFMRDRLPKGTHGFGSLSEFRRFLADKNLY